MASDEVLGLLTSHGRGEFSDGIALVRMLLLCGEPRALAATLEDAAGNSGTTARTAGHLLQVMARHGAAVDEAASLLRRHRRFDEEAPAPSPDAGVARARELFDWAQGEAPIGSVALYALGSEDRLAAATAEVCALMARFRMVEPNVELLDIGCGSGRIERALAGQVAGIIGIDISPRMIEAARLQCRAFPNVRFALTDGVDLAGFAADGFDAVIAVDSFPYLFSAGGPPLAGRMVAEAARVLRPGGRLLILNLSYRQDLPRDRAELDGFAAAAGLRVARAGTADLRLWDGLSFLLEKPRRPPGARR